MPSGATAEGRLDKAIRLFRFLTHVQQQKVSPVRDVDAYLSRTGEVVWLGKLPQHRAISGAFLKAVPDPSEPILVIRRVDRTDPPAPPPELADWLIPNTWLDPESEPELCDSLTRRRVTADGAVQTVVEQLVEHPEVEDVYLDWLQDWTIWSRSEAEQEPIRSDPSGG